ncbi:carbohydrate ABC transporter permease, partial [Streptomyces sp. NPDC059900]
MTTLTPPTRPAAPGRRLTAPGRRPRAGTALTYLSLVVASLVVLVPLLVVFLTSLKTSREVTDGGAMSLPENWLNFSNYATAFNDGKMLMAFGNTAFILLFSITGTVLIGSMTAYAIDRFDFRLKKTVMALFLIATLVPGVTTQVATFQVVNSFGLFDTHWAPILL